MITLAPTYQGKVTVPSVEVTDLMLDMLALKLGDKVMEIGTGTGYQTWRLCQTGAEVQTIEIEPRIDPAHTPENAALYFHTGDGWNGIPNEAPFAGILVSCGVKEIPSAWIEQLAEGGRLVAPVGDMELQKLILFTKIKDELIPVRVAAYVRFLVLTREKPKGKIPYENPEK